MGLVRCVRAGSLSYCAAATRSLHDPNPTTAVDALSEGAPPAGPASHALPAQAAAEGGGAGGAGRYTEAAERSGVSASDALAGAARMLDAAAVELHSRNAKGEGGIETQVVQELRQVVQSALQVPYGDRCAQLRGTLSEQQLSGLSQIGSATSGQRRRRE